MKSVFFISGFAIALYFLLSGFSLRENPQYPPQSSKKRHIKLVKLKDGIKTELDTFVEGDGFFAWDGDTIGRELKCLHGKGENIFVSSGKYNYRIGPGKDGEKHKIVIITSSEEDGDIICRKINETDSAECIILKTEKVKESADSCHTISFPDGGDLIVDVPCLPDMPCPPGAPHPVFLNNFSKATMIDLNDPGIISYRKKKLSNGREKIEIVREEKSKDEMNIIQPSETMFHTVKTKPTESKGVRKVIRIVEDDGKVFHIREKQEGPDVMPNAEPEEGKNIEEEESGK